MASYAFRRRRRDNTTIANRRLPRFANARLSPSLNYYHGRSDSSRRLQLYEDRRQWHPEGSSAPARSFSVSRHRLTVVRPKANRDSSRPFDWSGGILTFGEELSPAVTFQSPSRVLVCVRRKVRKEVLHSLGKTGRLGQNKPRFSEYSSISCRR